MCSVSFCVHYVTSTEDAPPLADADANGVPDQVTATLDTLESVLDLHTRVLGYRPPATDGTRGGSAQFDVYLSQLAGDGLYGFCAPEEKVPGQRSSTPATACSTTTSSSSRADRCRAFR